VGEEREHTHTYTNTQMCKHNMCTQQLEYTTWEKKENTHTHAHTHQHTNVHTQYVHAAVGVRDVEEEGAHTHTRTHTKTHTQMCTHNTCMHQLEYTTWEKKGHGNHKRIQELNKDVEAQRKVIDDMPLLPGDKDKKDRNTCNIHIYIDTYVCISISYFYIYVYLDKKDQNTCEIYICIDMYVCMSKYVFVYICIQGQEGSKNV